MADETVHDTAQGRRALLRGLTPGGPTMAAAGADASQPQSGSTTAAPAPLPTTPDDAVQQLRDGNQRLIANQVLHKQSLDQIRQHASGQSPYAQVFGCADSRVPVEVVFDADFGDLFVTRTAGNVLSDPVVGTIEYGVQVLNTPLILVLGHTGCGAVKAAVDAVKDPKKAPTGALGALVSAIQPAVRKVQGRGGDVYAAALEEHIRSTVAALQGNPALARPLGAGQLRVLGAVYDLGTAKVTFY
jgi:carbonic anhydrase